MILYEGYKEISKKWAMERYCLDEKKDSQRLSIAVTVTASGRKLGPIIISKATKARCISKGVFCIQKVLITSGRKRPGWMRL